MSERSDAGPADGDSPVEPKRKPERRWPMAAAVLAAAGLQVITPREGRLPAWWVIPIVEVAMLVILIARDPGRIDKRSVALRRQTIFLIGFMTAATIGGVIRLSWQILDGTSRVSAGALLGRGAGVWITNVIVFSLWYWELDRGGPAERAAAAPIEPSFVFPEDGIPERVAEGWMPQYPDYLYLAFSTGTAFSATDTAPVRMWAKMTLLLESSLSLVIAVLVVARAINVLPGS
ncbi:MAG TPA: hypothetical protein VNN79_25010 [Actinomycetota bacterium]|nr:hypothetical protein [Actinomycetota bacterium]